MMAPEMDRLRLKAKKVLEDNWVGSYTRPSSALYPHQWSWDSGFIAIGLSTYAPERAMTELRSLFRGQWKNGMVPQIVYSGEAGGEYFPDASFWKAERSLQKPDGVMTSGITQPPVHAISAHRIFQRSKDNKKAHAFLEEMYPRLYSSHHFFHEVRDPGESGLAYIRHPWESGLDNSPTWDGPLERIDLGDEPKYQRRDLEKGVPMKQRPTDWDYNRYIYLVELFKKHNYDEQAIYDVCPFLVQDPLLNSILVKADQSLIEIGEILGKDTSEIRGWEKKTKQAINKKLWHRGHGFYDAFDLVADELIEVDSASGFIPLYGRIATGEQAKRLYEYLNSNSFCPIHEKRCFSIPNYNVESEYFDPQNYWRGPIWININWMLYQGLDDYDFQDKAESVKGDIIELVKRHGFYEYYDPTTGGGYGSKNFSWTAALFLDLLYNHNNFY